MLIKLRVFDIFVYYSVFLEFINASRGGVINCDTFDKRMKRKKMIGVGLFKNIVFNNSVHPCLKNVRETQRISNKRLFTIYQQTP